MKLPIEYVLMERATVLPNGPNVVTSLYFVFCFLGAGLVWRGRRNRYSLCGAFCYPTHSHSKCHCRGLAGKNEQDFSYVSRFKQTFVHRLLCSMWKNLNVLCKQNPHEKDFSSFNWGWSHLKVAHCLFSTVLDLSAGHLKLINPSFSQSLFPTIFYILLLPSLTKSTISWGCLVYFVSPCIAVCCGPATQGAATSRL